MAQRVNAWTRPRRWAHDSGFMIKKGDGTKNDEVTHLLLNGGKWKVPDTANERFLREYARSIFELEWNFIVERKTWPIFPMLAELDMKMAEPINSEQLRAIVATVQTVMHQAFPTGDTTLMVSTAEQKPEKYTDKDSVELPCIKSGVHLNWPRIHVDDEMAHGLRQMMIQALSQLSGVPLLEPWDTAFDRAIFSSSSGDRGNGLRMIGSRKAVKCNTGLQCWRNRGKADTCEVCHNTGYVDQGRPYALEFVAGPYGLPDEECTAQARGDPLFLVKMTSVRAIDSDGKRPKDPTPMVWPSPEFRHDVAQSVLVSSKLPAREKSTRNVSSTDALSDNDPRVVALKQLISEKRPEVAPLTSVVRLGPTVYSVHTQCRTCPNKGGPHHSSTVYLIVKPSGISLKCFCKKGTCPEYKEFVSELSDELYGTLWGGAPLLQDALMQSLQRALDELHHPGLRVTTASTASEDGTTQSVNVRSEPGGGNHATCPLSGGNHAPDLFFIVHTDASGRVTSVVLKCRNAGCKDVYKFAHVAVSTKPPAPVLPIPFETRVLTPEESYVANMPPCEAGSAIMLRSPPGTGKTEFIRGAINGLPPEARVMFITSRMSQARDVVRKLPGFTNYLDFKGKGDVDLSGARRLIISPESIYKARIRGQGCTMPAVELLIFDEPRTFVSNLTGCTMQSQGNAVRFTRRQLIAMIRNVTRNAKRVLFTDADMDGVVIRFFEKLLGNKHVHALDFVRPAGNGRRIKFVRKRTHVVSGIAAKLAAGKRVVVPCSHQKHARQLARYIRAKFPGKKVVQLDRDASPETKKGYSDVRTMWGPESCDILIYTSTIGVGMDYSVPIEEAFDVMYVIAGPDGPTSRDLVQMMYRPRHLRDPIVRVCILGKPKGPGQCLPDNAAEVREKLLGSIGDDLARFCRTYPNLVSESTFELAYNDEDYCDLLCEAIAERNRDLNDMCFELTTRAAAHGYEIMPWDAKPEDEGLPADESAQRAAEFEILTDMGIAGDDLNLEFSAKDQETAKRFEMARLDRKALDLAGEQYSAWNSLEDPRDQSPLSLSARKAVRALLRVGGKESEAQAFYGRTYGKHEPPQVGLVTVGGTQQIASAPEDCGSLSTFLSGLQLRIPVGKQKIDPDLASKWNAFSCQAKSGALRQAVHPDNEMKARTIDTMGAALFGAFGITIKRLVHRHSMGNNWYDCTFQGVDAMVHLAKHDSPRATRRIASPSVRAVEADYQAFETGDLRDTAIELAYCTDERFAEIHAEDQAKETRELDKKEAAIHKERPRPDEGQVYDCAIGRKRAHIETKYEQEVKRRRLV